MDRLKQIFELWWHGYIVLPALVQSIEPVSAETFHGMGVMPWNGVRYMHKTCRPVQDTYYVREP